MFCLRSDRLMLNHGYRSHPLAMLVRRKFSLKDFFFHKPILLAGKCFSPLSTGQWPSRKQHRTAGAVTSSTNPAGIVAHGAPRHHILPPHIGEADLGRTCQTEPEM